MKQHGHVKRGRGKAAENFSVLWDSSKVNVKNMCASVSAKALTARSTKDTIKNPQRSWHRKHLTFAYLPPRCELRLIVIELRQHPSKLIETYSEVEAIYCRLDVMNGPIPGCQVAEKGLLRVVFIWWGWKSRQLCFWIDRHVGIRDHVESLRRDSNREQVFWLQATFTKQTQAQCVYVRSDTIGGCLTKPKCVRYGCSCYRGQTAVGQYEANLEMQLELWDFKSLLSILKSSNLKPLSKL